MNHESYLRTRHFRSLDGVRAGCILAVLWHHTPHDYRASRTLDMGFLGVDMFFVLSGFLIVTLLLRERDRTGTISLRDFYVRRTLRIFPIYYLEILVVALALLVLKPGSEMARNLWGDLPYLLTYTANWVPVRAVNFMVVWSLACEEQFYLLWPGVERCLGRRAVLGVLAALLAVNQLVNFGVLDPWLARRFGPAFLQLSVVEITFTPILLGVLLAHVLHSRRGYGVVSRGLGARWSPPFVFAALVLLIEFGPGDISGLSRLAIQLTMALLLATLVVREDHAAQPLLTFGPLARLGVISYGIYLYHLWAVHCVREAFERLRLDDQLAFFAASLALSAVVAELSFRLIESPLLRLKRYFGGDPGGHVGHAIACHPEAARGTQ